MFVTRLRDNAVLQALELHHAEEFLTHMDRARTHIAPWVAAGFVVAHLESARTVLQRYADRQVQDERRLYGIWLDGTLVGGTMFVSFDAATGVCEIGCWLEPAAEGQGLISQVVRMMIDWAFGVRGLTRVEWRTLADNTRSITVAKRLGMSLDGTMRDYLPGADGVRRDQQVWSVLADEWPEGPTYAETSEYAEYAATKAVLDRLTHDFLDAFTNTGGRVPKVDLIREVFIPEGRIISNLGAKPVIYDLEAFIAPRETMLTDGTLTEFREWEVAERTEIFGSIAHRFSEYRKSGCLDGERFEGGGRKTVQFVATPDGWKMASLAWDDVA